MISFKEYLLVEHTQKMSLRKALAKLDKQGKPITVEAIAKLMSIPASTVRRVAKPLTVVYPEIARAFNADK